VLDEEAQAFVAVEAIMTSLGAHALFIGNPTKLSGTFYNSHHIDPKSCKIRISCFDTPNFTNNGIETIEDLKNLDEEALESAFLPEQAARTGMVVANPAKTRALRRL